VDILNEMEALIIVFDAIEHNIKLEDAIADAMRKGIKYQVENWEQFFCPDTRAADLLWCTVRFPFNSDNKCLIFSVKKFQVWNKDDDARQLLIDRKDETTTSINNVEQNKNEVRKTYNLNPH
jgi:hypothetical protein